jgi:hypothetical protein
MDGFSQAPRATTDDPAQWSNSMKNHLAFLLCSATGLLTWNVAQAATPPTAPSAAPQSYADLLEPIPNALAALIADELARARQPKPLVQIAQFYHHHHHHHSFYHHHHHHSFYPHHHHHHSGYYGGGVVVVPGPGYGPDCYIQRRVTITPWGERVVRNVRVCD